MWHSVYTNTQEAILSRGIKSICNASVSTPWPGSKSWCCAGTEGFSGMPRDQQGPFLAPFPGCLCWKGDGGAKHVGSFSALKGQSYRVIIRAVTLIIHGECCGKKQCKKLELLFLFLSKTVRTALPAQLCISSPAWPHPTLSPDLHALGAKMRGEGLRLGESDGCRILPSLLCCRDRRQASYMWAANRAASFLKTLQSSWLHDFITVLKSSQFMGFFMQLALVQGFFSIFFTFYMTSCIFFLNEWLPFS